jgi:hypothetical protein
MMGIIVLSVRSAYRYRDACEGLRENQGMMHGGHLAVIGPDCFAMAATSNDLLPLLTLEM